MLFRFVQPLKIFPAAIPPVVTDVQLVGILMLLKFVQFPNASRPIAITVSGICTVSRDTQFSKARMPISVTVIPSISDGIVALVIAASASIIVPVATLK